MYRSIFFCSFAFTILGRITLLKKMVKKNWYKAYEDALQAFVRRIYLCGIPVLTIRQLDNITSIELFTGLPVLAVERRDTKLCGYIGCLEMFKVRYRGSWPLPTEIPSFRPVERSIKKIFFDIGELHQKSGQYGIARTVFCLLAALRKVCPEGYEVYPVYASSHQAGYVYANKFLISNKIHTVYDYDYPIDISCGDIFLGGLINYEYYQHKKNALLAMIRAGIKIYFLFYDLIPISLPQYFPKYSKENFTKWLHFISGFDGIIADSASVAEDYRRWREKKMPDASKDFLIDWFHLGADFDRVNLSSGLPDNADSVLASLKSRPTLLEVSTIEPRKGYKQALAAFEVLWSKGIDANYVIVGNKGWMMDDFIKKLERHPELGKRLFWLRGISDEYLNKVYEACSGVLMPSEAEGFGLAVVEGAMHGKPLILRDIPVFREIAGDHATYFSGLEAGSLADCIKTWLDDLQKGSVISSQGIKPLTWDESAKMLLSKLPLQREPEPC